MGTSNLYKGPKGSSLLPADYTGESDEQPIGDTPVEQEQSETDETEKADNSEQEESQKEDATRVSWTQAKRTYSYEIGKQNPNVRLIAKNYTKASGGYKHAAKTSTSSKRVARGIITLFFGSSSDIRQRIEQSGIIFEERSTQEIFNDIYIHLSTGSASREDAIADRALSQTFSELFESDLMSEHSLEMFTPELLEFMVSHFVTNSIFYRLLNEVAFGEFTGDKSTADITAIEGELKTFIDGVVSGRVTEHLHKGVTQHEINKFVDDLYEDCYKVMEDLAK